MITMYVEFTCPYCQKQQRRLMEITESYNEPKVIMCDDEIGGCGRFLAIEVRINPQARVYSMKEMSK